MYLILISDAMDQKISLDFKNPVDKVFVAKYKKLNSTRVEITSIGSSDTGELFSILTCWS